MSDFYVLVFFKSRVKRKTLRGGVRSFEGRYDGSWGGWVCEEEKFFFVMFIYIFLVNSSTLLHTIISSFVVYRGRTISVEK